MPAQVGSGVYVDGAILHNNPALVALAEAATLLPGVPIDVMLSLGTGMASTKPSSLSRAGPIEWAAKVFECAMSSGPEHAVAATMLHDARAQRYWRFDTELELVPDGSETDPTIISLMTAAHERYLEHNGAALDALAAKLLS